MSLRPVEGCFYCEGPRGRDTWCPDHGDEARMESVFQAARRFLEGSAPREVLALAVSLVERDLAEYEAVQRSVQEAWR